MDNDLRAGFLRPLVFVISQLLAIASDTEKMVPSLSHIVDSEDTQYSCLTYIWHQDYDIAKY